MRGLNHKHRRGAPERAAVIMGFHPGRASQDRGRGPAPRRRSDAGGGGGGGHPAKPGRAGDFRVLRLRGRAEGCRGWWREGASWRWGILRGWRAAAMRREPGPAAGADCSYPRGDGPRRLLPLVFEEPTKTRYLWSSKPPMIRVVHRRKSGGLPRRRPVPLKAGGPGAGWEPSGGSGGRRPGPNRRRPPTARRL